MSKCIVPGTFDPMHRGHLNVVERASRLFDEVVVAVAASKEKKPTNPLEDRVELAKDLCKKFTNVTVKPFDCLLVDFVKKEGAKCVVKGLRNCKDFEHELSMAAFNKKLSNDFETIFLMSDPQNINISSTLIRELESFGVNVDKINDN